MAGQITMPGVEAVPEGAHRALLTALHELRDASGRSSSRELAAVLSSRDDLPATMSHSLISGLFNGARFPRCLCVRALVTVLAERTNPPRDAVAESNRIERLWRAVDDERAQRKRRGGLLAVQAKEHSTARLALPVGVTSGATRREDRSVLDLSANYSNPDPAPSATTVLTVDETRVIAETFLSSATWLGEATWDRVIIGPGSGYKFDWNGLISGAEPDADQQWSWRARFYDATGQEQELGHSVVLEGIRKLVYGDKPTDVLDGIYTREVRDWIALPVTERRASDISDDNSSLICQHGLYGRKVYPTGYDRHFLESMRGTARVREPLPRRP